MAFLGAYYQSIATSLPYYELSLNNFDVEFENIDPEHLEYFDQGSGLITIDSAKNYLKSLLMIDASPITLDAPKMCVERSDNDIMAGLALDGNFDVFRLSNFNIHDGSHESYETDSNELDIVLKNGIRLNIFTVYGISEGNRSNLYIIIIDKDLFYCDGSRYTFRQPDDWTTRKVRSLNIGCAPNPAFNKTTFSFQLQYDQQVSLELIDSYTGSIMAQTLESNYLQKGDHQVGIDLEMLQPGVYHLVLKANRNILSIPFIKLE